MAVSPSSGVRLPKKNEELLTQISTELRNCGASDIEIDNATPGLSRAIYTDYRLGTVKHISRAITGLLCAFIVFVPWLLSFNGYMSSQLQAVLPQNEKTFYLIYVCFMLSMFFLAIEKRAFVLFFDSEIRHSQRVKELIMMLLAMLMGLFAGLSTLLSAGLFKNIWHISIWRILVVILYVACILSVMNITVKVYMGAERRIIAFFRPGSALIISLCRAFLAVRNERSWHDQAYRNRIAGHLAVAADAIEKYMPRCLGVETGVSSLAAVRQRFKETAIPLRCQILWLATPGRLTRADLEAELRNAVIAASLGELARLEEFPDRTQPIQAARRPWWVVAINLCRAILWAFAPFALVQLGSTLQWPFLTEPDQRSWAQKAAYAWLALAILRWLSPSNFKETIEAAGTVFGRGKPKGAE